MFSRFTKSYGSIIALTTISTYGGYRFFSDNGKELSMINSSISLEKTQTTPPDGSIVKMNGIVGRLSKNTTEIDYMNQYKSGNKLLNDVQFHPIYAERSSFLLGRRDEEADEDPSTRLNLFSFAGAEYNTDNNVMAMVFEIEEMGKDQKYASRSQWIVMRPGFSAKAVENFDSSVESLEFNATNHQVFELDVFRNCYFEFPQDSDNSIYSMETHNVMEYRPPQSKRELLEFLVNNRKITYPSDWTIDELMKNVKAHIIHRTRGTPIPPGRQVRITEAFINSGDRIFIVGQVGNQKDPSYTTEDGAEAFLEDWKPNPNAPLVKCKLLVNGKSEEAYTRELKTELMTDAVVATAVTTASAVAARFLL